LRKDGNVACLDKNSYSNISFILCHWQSTKRN
jgi:hypothetical protein